MKYVIGVDAGGTKTEAIAYDIDGKVIAKSIQGFGNLLNNVDDALFNIESSVSEIISTLGSKSLQGVYVGAAGCEVGENAKLIEKRLKQHINVDIKVMNDAEIALKAMLKGCNGILTIAGTGSIVFGINNGISSKCGGWGNLLGDEGSGYQIVISAIKRMIKEEEENLPQSKLTKAILEELKINSVNDITEFVYSVTKDEIASLTHIIAKLAREGDKISEKILVEQGVELAKTVERLYKRLNFNNCSIGLVGGVIRNIEVFKIAFEDYLKDNINVENFIYDEVSPAKGAYYEYITKVKRGRF